jgi:ethanolamine utilization protein EutA
LLPAAANRATVLGALNTRSSSRYHQLHSDAANPPPRRTQVARPDYAREWCNATRHRGNERHPSVFGGTSRGHVALALRERPPSYRRLRAFAEGVIGGLWRRISDGRAIYLMIDGDIALTLGTILREELAVANDLLILDGIDLRDFDFVDLGRIRHPSNTVPVTIKSLVFATSGDPVNPAVAIA